jgi:hypothetical protein
LQGDDEPGIVLHVPENRHAPGKWQFAESDKFYALKFLSGFIVALTERYLLSCF